MLCKKFINNNKLFNNNSLNISNMHNNNSNILNNNKTILTIISKGTKELFLIMGINNNKEGTIILREVTTGKNLIRNKDIDIVFILL